MGGLGRVLEQLMEVAQAGGLSHSAGHIMWPVHPSSTRRAGRSRSTHDMQDGRAIEHSPWVVAITDHKSLHVHAHLLGLLDGHLDGADHVERLLGEVVPFALENLLERAYRVFAGDVLAGQTGKDLCDEHRL